MTLVVETDDGGIELHTAARLDPAMKHPLTTFVTRANYPEAHAFSILANDVAVHEGIDSVIFVFDKGYVNYGRFAGLKNDGVDFVIPKIMRNTTERRYESLTNTSRWEP